MSVDSRASSLKKFESDVVGFKKLAEYLRRETGIHLPVSDKNQTLLASRVSKIMESAGVSNYSELHAALLAGRRDVKDIFINAATTNTTHFFREKQHFDYLQKHALDLLNHPAKKKDREIRVWCAACSTGEEAYSLAMQISSILPPLAGWKLRILATDIDTDVLKTAIRGVYTSDAADTISDAFKTKYFEQGTGSSVGYVRVRKNLRDLITFAQFNLMSPAYTFQNKFDIIFCRNVMIYFDRAEIQSTILKMEGCLRTGGLLFVGHSETIMGLTPGLKARAPAVYERLSVARKGEVA